MSVSINDLIKIIASDKTKGSSELASQALKLVKDAAVSSKAKSIEEFYSEIRHVLYELSKCRPAMAVLKNCMDLALGKIDNIYGKGSRLSLESMKVAVSNILESLIDEMAQAKADSISNAVSLIKDFSAIATCSYSSTLVEVFKNISEKNKNLTLKIMLSEYGNYSYGRIMEEKLKGTAIKCILIEDSSNAGFLDETNIVLLGSDTIFKDGSALNGYPSLKLAELASMHKPEVPVYVVSDFLKFAKTLPDKNREPGFDLIPAYLIKGIITEKGIFTR